MNTAKVFPNGRSQAVRLPKDYQFLTSEVYINKVGDIVMLFPKEAGWESLARSLECFSSDFMQERNQSDSPDERKAL